MRRFLLTGLLALASCSSYSRPAQPTPIVQATATVVPTPLAVHGFTSFVMPSRNIRCELTGDAVRCDPTEHSWTVPPKPATCEFDWGGSLGVSTLGVAHFLCVSDAIPDGPVLAYGQSILDGPILCESSPTGVTCTSQASSHGFTVSRENYTLY